MLDGRTSDGPFSARILVGATATGKTAVAAVLARRTGALLLSADSMLVYRGMDIGTAKPNAEERAGTDLRGMDLASPGEPFSVGAWLRAAREAAREARDAGRDLLVVGGTGLYVNALLRGIDAPAADPALRARLEEALARDGLPALVARAEALAPEAAAAVDRQNPRRVIRLLEKALSSGGVGSPASVAGLAASAAPGIVGLAFPRDALALRIRRRAETMFASGLLEEVRALRAAHPAFSATAGVGIGYAEAGAVLDGTLTVPEALEKVAARTRHLAKRQETWFRHQLDVTWIPGPVDGTDAERCADEILAFWRTHGKTPLALD